MKPEAQCSPPGRTSARHASARNQSPNFSRQHTNQGLTRCFHLPHLHTDRNRSGHSASRSVQAVLLTVLSRKAHLPTIVLASVGRFCLRPRRLVWLKPSHWHHTAHDRVAGDRPDSFRRRLTLDVKQFSQTSPVLNVYSRWALSSRGWEPRSSAYLVFDTPPSFALLMGSLVIVTGPTVIVPMLRRIRTHQKLCRILHWEGVLIDSIGVFIAILCFEWVVEGGGTVALPSSSVSSVASGSGRWVVI